MGTAACGRCVIFGRDAAMTAAITSALSHQGARIVEVRCAPREPNDAAAAAPRDQPEAARDGRAVHGEEGDAADRAPVATLRMADDAVDGFAPFVEHAAGLLGGLDACIFCALTPAAHGPTPAAFISMDAVDIDEWDRVHRANTRDAFFFARDTLPFLRASGGGNIVFVGSIDAVKPVPSPVHFAASQGALAAMVRAMAKELGADGVCVNMVASALLDSALLSHVPAPVREAFLRHSALRRLGELSEVARVVAQLALHNRYVTGRVVALDGGL